MCFVSSITNFCLPKLQRYSPVFSSRSFIVLALTFRFVIQHELSFANSVKQEWGFIFPCLCCLFTTFLQLILLLSISHNSTSSQASAAVSASETICSSLVLRASLSLATPVTLCFCLCLPQESFQVFPPCLKFFPPSSLYAIFSVLCFPPSFLCHMNQRPFLGKYMSS